MDTRLIFSFSDPKFKLVLLATLLIVVSSCHGPSHNKGPLAKIAAHKNDPVSHTITSDNINQSIDKVAITNQDADTLFYVPNRTTQIQSFPCASCHTTDLNLMVADNPLGKKAHWDIKINHATNEVLTCATCHNPENINLLRLNTDMHVNFNQSQKLCAQCHSSQANDWLGGAHGKQLGSWAPPRVSKTCVNCHNPHSPAFEKRWPARLNKTKIQELDPK